MENASEWTLAHISKHLPKNKKALKSLLIFHMLDLKENSNYKNYNGKKGDAIQN